jgi:hypothetical protein
MNERIKIASQFYYPVKDEIKNDIQKSRLKWFIQVMQKRKRVYKKTLHTKIESK